MAIFQEVVSYVQDLHLLSLNAYYFDNKFQKEAYETFARKGLNKSISDAQVFITQI